MILTDPAFHPRGGDPPNQKVCQRGTWNVRMLIETVLSMFSTVCHLKKLSQRTWHHLRARLAFTLAVFTLLVQWHGLVVDPDGTSRLSIAEFSL